MKNIKWLVTKRDLVIIRKRNIIKEIYILADIYDNLYYHPYAKEDYRTIKIDITNIMLKTAKVYNIKNNFIVKLFEELPEDFEVYKNKDRTFTLKNVENLEKIILDVLKEG